MSATIVVRITIANTGPQALDHLLDHLRRPATAWATVGYFDGITETGATLETTVTGSCAEHRLRTQVAEYLTQLGEQSAYVTLDGQDAQLWYADGRQELL